jgi:hypothetical protein
VPDAVSLRPTSAFECLRRVVTRALLGVVHPWMKRRRPGTLIGYGRSGSTQTLYEIRQRSSNLLGAVLLYEVQSLDGHFSLVGP